MSDWRMAIDRRVDAMSQELIAMRRHLHVHPEPSGSEFATSQFVSNRLQKAGIKNDVAPSGRGVIAEGGSQSNGIPLVAFRADLDALLLDDQKEVDYRSGCPGVMHACGHDAHTTIAYGVARTLAEIESELPWPTRWRAVFQPAEETGEGAREMMAAGAIDGVSQIVALHVWPDLPVGEIGLREGPLTAYCQAIDIQIKGAGGHGARPHEAADPIAAAAQFINAVYQIVPRFVDSRDPSVVTFGAIHGGGSRGVIPDAVTVKGTIRTVKPGVRDAIDEKIMQIAKGLAETLGVKFTISFPTGVASVDNDARVAKVIADAAGEVLGMDAVRNLPLTSMGGEDFGEYLTQTTGCMFRLGITSEKYPRRPLHSSQFDLDERAIVYGAKILARTVVLLSNP